MIFIPFILTVTIALSISFMCNLMEACLLSLSTTDIADLTERKPFAGRIWKHFREHIEQPIAVILIVNTLAHTIGATISGSQFHDLFGPKWIFLYSLVFSFVMIQWTELVPKTLGVRFNRLVAGIMAVPMKLSVQFLKPIVVVAEFLNRPFDRNRSHHQPDTLNEINLLARFALYNRLITQEQKDIVARSIQLSNTSVNDIMVERNDIKYLSTSMNMAEALIAAHIHHHTRYPLIKENNLDEVVGYVNVKDIVSALKLNPKDPSLTGIARPIMTIKPDRNVTSLLKDMTKGYQHMAIVTNTEGKIVGVVTLEDVTEAIVGEIHDEYDIIPNFVFTLAEARYLAGGGIDLKTLREKTGADLPDQSISLNDWLFQIFTQPPKIEAKISYKGFAFIIRKMRRSKICEVIIEKIEAIQNVANN
ncbi:MAG: CNNM domain-containing protein [Kiritimatiellae bacterium]|nr:CNNM domain-containing protein [Kiritimatiellia bacterium]MDD5523043.1 CNNM domain-containing protein [Kiritimatiellia bacterium]